MINEQVLLRPAHPDEAAALWHACYDDTSWAETNAPYFPFSVPTLEAFCAKGMDKLCAGEMARIIEYRGQIIGQVSCYWECEATRWLEAGIALFAGEHRGCGLGRQALAAWISQLFARFEVERIGLTTWSGNPGMMRCAEALGFTLEGRLRKVRYYQGEYHDALRYGVLREEWEAR